MKRPAQEAGRLGRFLMGLGGLAALLLSVRRNALWSQYVASLPSVSSGFDVLRSTAVYHAPWVKMPLPLLITAAFVWTRWLVGQIVSLAGLLWLAGMYFVWLLDRTEIHRKMADGDLRLDPSALVFYEVKWHDVSILVLTMIILVYQLKALVGRLRRSGSNEGGRTNQDLHPSAAKDTASGDAPGR